MEDINKKVDQKFNSTNQSLDKQTNKKHKHHSNFLVTTYNMLEVI